MKKKILFFLLGAGLTFAGMTMMKDVPEKALGKGSETGYTYYQAKIDGNDYIVIDYFGKMSICRK